MRLENSNLLKVLSAIMIATALTLSFAHADAAIYSGVTNW